MSATELIGPCLTPRGGESEGEGSCQDLRQLIDSVVRKYKVMVFSKAYCPYCDRAKALFDKLNVDYAHAELDHISNGGQIQDMLQKMTGQRTVPNIFINGKHVGGCDKVHELHRSGQLAAMLSQSQPKF